eukprot:SAG11_NODE_34350_length_272_cov_0.965318_1_plen_47_part_10
MAHMHGMAMAMQWHARRLARLVMADCLQSEPKAPQAQIRADKARPVM